MSYMKESLSLYLYFLHSLSCDCKPNSLKLLAVIMFFVTVRNVTVLFDSCSFRGSFAIICPHRHPSRIAAAHNLHIQNWLASTLKIEAAGFYRTFIMTKLSNYRTNIIHSATFIKLAFQAIKLQDKHNP